MEEISCVLLRSPFRHFFSAIRHSELFNKRINFPVHDRRKIMLRVTNSVVSYPALGIVVCSDLL
jgi:hypothetical protein